VAGRLQYKYLLPDAWPWRDRGRVCATTKKWLSLTCDIIAKTCLCVYHSLSVDYIGARSEYCEYRLVALRQDPRVRNGQGISYSSSTKPTDEARSPTAEYVPDKIHMNESKDALLYIWTMYPMR